MYKSLILLLTLSLTPSIATAQSSPLWERVYTDSITFLDVEFNAMVVDDAGFIYVTGFVYVTFYDGDFLTVKYDPSGNKIWEARYDNTLPFPDADEYATAIALDDSNNVIITGYSYNAFNDEMVTVKYDSQGNQKWVKKYNSSSDDEPVALITDDDGNSIIIFETFGGSRTIKYDLNGNQVWNNLQNSISSVVKDLDLDADGNVYVAGGSTLNHWDANLRKYNASGSLAWDETHYGTFGWGARHYGVEIDSDNNIYTLGIDSDTSLQSSKPVINKYDSSGTLLWSRIYPHGWIWEPVSDNSKELFKMDSAGDVYFAFDSTYGQGPTIVAKYDSSGSLVWWNHFDYSTSTSQRVRAITVDKYLNTYVTGYILDTAVIGPNILSLFVLKYDASGVLQWMDEYARPGSVLDYSTMIQTDEGGNVYVCGAGSYILGGSNYVYYGILLKYLSACGATGLSVVSQPTPNICLGDSVQLLAPPGISYQWYKNNQLISGANMQSFFASQAGNYKCYVTYADTICNGFTNTVRVLIICRPRQDNQWKQSPVVEPALFEVSVSPNPSANAFVFDIDSNLQEDIKIIVRDLTGRQIQADFTKLNPNQYLLQKLPTGFYFANLQCGGISKSIKLIQGN